MTKSRPFRELFVITVVALAAYFVADAFDVLDTFVIWYQMHEEAHRLGGLIVASLVLALALVVFSLRRWREAERQAVERARAEAAQRASDEALRRSEKYFRSLIEKASEAIFILDGEARIRYASPSVEKVLGYSPSELLGKNAFEFIHPDDIALAQQAALSGIDIPGHTETTEYRLRHRSGGWRLFEVTGRNLLNDPTVAGLVVNMRDVTERTTAEAARTRRTRQLAALSRMGESVLSTLDLQQVLNQVVGEVSTLLPTHEISILLREKEELVFAAVGGRAAQVLQGQRMPVDVGIAGEVIREGEARYVSGSEADARMYLNLDRLADYVPRSLLAVPLRHGSQVFGVLEAVHGQVNAFDQEDLQLMDGAADWAAIAIANAQEHEELRRRLAETRAMADINLALSETLDLDEIFKRIVNAAQEIIPNTQQAVIHLLQEPDQTLQAVAASMPGEPHENGSSIPLDEGISQVLACGAPLNVSDVQADPRYLSHGPSNTRSLLVVPMQSGTRRLGTISVQSITPNAFSIDDEHLLARLGIQASIAITNARLFEQVRAGREQLQALSKQLLETQETERQRIVRELYGEIGQELSALKMSLMSLERACTEANFAKRVEDIGALAGGILDRVRTMSHELRPSLLDDLGLEAALRWLLDQQSRRGGFTCEFVAEGLQVRLSPQIETACYRVAQEALTNVVRHSQANHVLLRISTHPTHLDLQVRDNGIGFDAAEARSRALQGTSLGLLGMDERLRLADGQLEIESAPGYGTEIRARLPIPCYDSATPA